MSDSKSQALTILFMNGDKVQLERTGLSTVADVKRILQEQGKIPEGSWLQLSEGESMLQSEAAVSDLSGDIRGVLCTCRDKLLISLENRYYHGTLVELRAPDDAEELVRLQPFLEKLPFDEGCLMIETVVDKAPVTARNKIRMGNTSQRNDKGKWDWTFYIDSLGRKNFVEEVTVTLHPTFKNPVRKLEAVAPGPACQERFELSLTGWGTFELKVDILWKGGQKLETTYMLQFVENSLPEVSELAVPDEVLDANPPDEDGFEDEYEGEFDEMSASAKWYIKVIWGDQRLDVENSLDEAGWTLDEDGSIRAWCSFQEALGRGYLHVGPKKDRRLGSRVPA